MTTYVRKLCLCIVIQVFAIAGYVRVLHRIPASMPNNIVKSVSRIYLGLDLTSRTRLLATIARAPLSNTPRAGKTISSNHIGVHPAFRIVLSFRERLLHLSLGAVDGIVSGLFVVNGERKNVPDDNDGNGTVTDAVSRNAAHTGSSQRSSPGLQLGLLSFSTYDQG